MSASPGRRYSRGVALDWFFFVFAGVAAIWLAGLSLTQTLATGWWAVWAVSSFVDRCFVGQAAAAV